MKPASPSEQLVWSYSEGYGFYPVSSDVSTVYGHDYHLKYVDYMKTELGHKLNVFRSAFVDNFWKGPIVDIGCAAGHFLMIHGLWRSKGYELNLFSAEWLRNLGVFFDLRSPGKIEAMSFFDSLEHIENPDFFLERVSRCVFISIPIFRDRDQAVSSRHFRPDEHFWYFTQDGLVAWMKKRGFSLEGIRNEETLLGREDILTFAFRRAS